MTNRSFRFGFGLLALTLASACGGDKITQPVFGTGCQAGSLSAGNEVSGQFDRASCELPYHFWSGNTVNYATFSVTLTKGKGYHFYANSIADDSGDVSGTRLLVLYGKSADGQSVPLTMSSEDGGGPGSAAEFYFISPRSGSFNLVVSNYNSDDLGGYRVTMDECPVLGVIEDEGSFDYEMPTNGACIRRNMAYTGIPSRIALIGIEVIPSAAYEASVVANNFSPRIELGGPDFDTFAYLYDDAQSMVTTGNGSIAQVTMGENASGMLTLAVGGDQLEPDGPFTVTVTESPLVLVSAQAANALGRSRLPHRNLGLMRPTLK